MDPQQPWVGEWRGQLQKLTTASRKGIENACKFAIAQVAEAEAVVQVSGFRVARRRCTALH
jgi:hypothetical protein